jgi:hypothetical protein
MGKLLSPQLTELFRMTEQPIFLFFCLFHKVTQNCRRVLHTQDTFLHVISEIKWFVKDEEGEN